MSQILNHPFYKASKALQNQIVNDIDANLSVLTSSYVPNDSDRKIFFPYGDKYVLLSTFSDNHAQFFFDTGREITEKVEEHEKRIGKAICKEGLYAIMSNCAVLKNDILNYRTYLEKMLKQRSLYNPASTSLINLINNKPEFGSMLREANRIFDANSIIKKMQAYFSPLDFTIVCTLLSDFQQHQFVTQIVQYRLLHFSLADPDCPNIAFEYCYNLIQHLCVIIEASLKDKKHSTLEMGKILLQQTNEPYKSLLNANRAAYPTRSIPDFNLHFPNIVAAFSSCTVRDEMIAYCLYIAYMCRNQVLHNVDSSAIFHGNGLLTEQVIGILLVAVYFTDKV